jgi:vancomycin aglycone glucosyltransferase
MAALAGAPQVNPPQPPHQPPWPRREPELGIGPAHDGPGPTADSLAGALETALDDATRERATALAPLIRTDGAAEAARLLIES